MVSRLLSLGNGYIEEAFEKGFVLLRVEDAWQGVRSAGIKWDKWPRQTVLRLWLWSREHIYGSEGYNYTLWIGWYGKKSVGIDVDHGYRHRQTTSGYGGLTTLQGAVGVQVSAV